MEAWEEARTAECICPGICETMGRTFVEEETTNYVGLKQTLEHHNGNMTQLDVPKGVVLEALPAHDRKWYFAPPSISCA